MYPDNDVAGGSRLYSVRNGSTRIDAFDELSHTATAALRAFCRRLGAPHLFDEVLLPTAQDGESQLFAAVRDRPWPPWGVGARHVMAICQIQAIADRSYAVSPVYVTDEDVTNVGLIMALYKEVLESVAHTEDAEINYLVAEGSVLAAQVLTSVGFRQSEDVFLTERARYYTYRAPVRALLKALGLSDVETPDILSHTLPPAALQSNALFHHTVYLGSRADWAIDRGLPEIIQLVRGGHAGKPGGVPSGTGRFGYPDEIINPADWFFVTLENFLGDARRMVLEHALKREQDFKPSMVTRDERDGVDQRFRRSKTLDDLGDVDRLFTGKLKEALAPAMAKLKLPAFPVGRVEMQMTASGDGDYFRIHRDGDLNSTRQISFVYFFHNEPRRFSGGEVRIFDAASIEGRSVPTDRSQILSPRQDVMVFFPSQNEHEVLPVRVPSRAFADSRFTLNGWIHAAT